MFRAVQPLPLPVNVDENETIVFFGVRSTISAPRTSKSKNAFFVQISILNKRKSAKMRGGRFEKYGGGGVLRMVKKGKVVPHVFRNLPPPMVKEGVIRN